MVDSLGIDCVVDWLGESVVKRVENVWGTLGPRVVDLDDIFVVVHEEVVVVSISPDGSVVVFSIRLVVKLGFIISCVV